MSGKSIVVGIDASNLRQGGGVTHLVEILRYCKPKEAGVSRVVLWGCEETLDAVTPQDWLEMYSPVELKSGTVKSLIWKKWLLTKQARLAGCNVLFVPGGAFSGSFKPFVTMSRNMLPFEFRELSRFGISRVTLRYLLLRWIQARTFRRADGMIFLTDYARKRVLNAVGYLSGRVVRIPHGVDVRFHNLPKRQQEISRYSEEAPFRLLYVSIVNHYKHQWHVVDAVAQLRAEGYPLALDLVGPAYGPAMERLHRSMDQRDPVRAWANYHGPMPYTDLHSMYARSDMGVFASSCENLPNILLEAMSAGLPIVSSDRGPMPEVLGDSGQYFDPEVPDSIAKAIRAQILSPKLRADNANSSSIRAQEFSWAECARKTFALLAEVGQVGSQ